MIAFYIDTILFRYEISSFEFSAGERQVRLPCASMPDSIEKKLVIRADIRSSQLLLDLLLTVDALKRKYGNLSRIEKVLYLPYLPYSRQDRVCAEGEALSIAVFANLINSLGFDKVVTLDCHSEVGVALIHNSHNVRQAEIVKDYLSLELNNGQIAFVSPDAGANKKVFELYSEFGTNNILVKADKIRNPVTGEITGVSVNYSELPHEYDYLIVDDICDGGRTFTELAQVLKNKGAQNIFLWVTHGIFSKGITPFIGLFSGIYRTDSFTYKGAIEDNTLATLKLQTFLVVSKLIKKEFGE